ncbi:MAG: ComF family protein, partial [Kiritimatiellae bacterium]|nr:ComF family protein [Kiritimatiellia bacterium]
ERRLAGKCILLADDVMTTGASFDAAARALRDGGAARVICVSFARD